MNPTSPTLQVRAVDSVCPKRTALVVEDVEDMLDLLEIALNASDFSVLRASSAPDALELFRTRANDIDLLMTDVRVGTDSGLELAQSLLAAKPSLQVLAISGFALEGRIVNGKTKIEFLAKPFSSSELRKKIHSIFAPPPDQVIVTVSGHGPGHFRVSASCPAELPGKKPGLH